MKLTNGVEQAICILVLLATQENNKPLASDVISEKLEVSPSYMKKIMRKLVVGNIVSSVSGTNGGVSLAKELNDISLLDVIEAMEGPISMFPNTGLIQKAFKGGIYTDIGESLIQNLFGQADALLKDYFSKITAADMIKENFGNINAPKLDWNNVTLSEFLKNKQGDEN
ncbi:Rrf2 family transcriptional regulator [Niallia alba]|uniref:Rrf2 family transcriptional regulator n=1 Tax=Niallia circulans TaxID=1397 RepID=A0A941JI31_NIACI|nr:Rrf2 family transcriptional regulator [Niallia circulans]MCB5239587.1 Rrf2 family transcriptional regulator [Niallia circulans]MDU1848357.1 Rrf2 family transcriptional regulator [Niallia nealsonii]